MKIRSFLSAIAVLCLSAQAANAVGASQEAAPSAYLFAYFTGNDNTRAEEAIRYAISTDGYTYRALNDNQPIVSSADIATTGGVRDPHILRGPDGRFYMVVTDMVSANGWDSNRAMVLMRSDNLLDWTSSVVNIQQKYPGQDDLLRVWAPQTIYDPEARRMMVYWSMKHGDGPDIIYYAYANDDFTDIVGEPKVLFTPTDGRSCIDGDIVERDGTYHLFYKTEGHGDGIRKATTKSLTSGKWVEEPGYKQLTNEAVEGAGTFRLIGQDRYILMYDVYIQGGYEFTETTDLSTFAKTTHPVSMNFHPRHGSVMAISAAEKEALLKRWGTYDSSDRSGKGISEASVCSPDGRLCLTVNADGGRPTYSLTYDGQTVLAPSPLGFRSDIADFTDSLTLASRLDSRLTDSYTLTHSKRSAVDVDARVLDCHFVRPDGKDFNVEFRLSNNDLAFRYLLPRQGDTGSVRILSEATGFSLPEGSTAFVSPQSDPMIGWKRTKPSYEEEYLIDVPVGTPSKYGHGFTFPALFRTPGGWVLVSETGVGRRYCASRLSEGVGGTYTIEFPMPGENNGNGTSEPGFALPGATPWRTITVGSTLAPIAETTVMWDYVEPRFEAKGDYPGGRGTWSWILWQDDSINPDDIRSYIDLAAAMGYDATLVDCGWDTNIGRDGMKALADYGREKGVDLFVWYSSSGYWNDITQSPINIMDDPVARRNEMAWLRSIGARGIKVDFFGGDKQETMRLYDDILADANDAGLEVIFHGCTIPRGWERIYPNYVGSEAVLASENLIFDQHFCDTEARCATLHPFIRNTVGSMEFGGTFLNRRMSRDNASGNTRLTGDAFELATAVLFQSPRQNFALAPNNLTDAPAEAIEFMKRVPVQWDDTRFVDGYPGRYAALARRSGDRWLVAAVNAGDKPVTLRPDLSFIPEGPATIIYDAPDGKLTTRRVTISHRKPLELTIAPSGGLIVER